ncbi:MAG TPA: DUF2231 domain-containing protein [Candidatus Paceibacterota bacterium]|nr:DUF2231 domain-containing protein [Candidatus Paceibacterota bacterium]
MNLHPAFVHLPIGLLTLYVLFEVVPFGRWYPRAAWEDIKFFLVAVGGLGLLAALATGQLAESSTMARAARNVLRLHKNFAGLSTAIFGILAAAYLIRWIFEKHADLLGPFAADFSFVRDAANVVLKRRIAVPMALAGFIALSITGALGGIIVYGQNVDFMTKFVYSLFFH